MLPNQGAFRLNLPSWGATRLTLTSRGPAGPTPLIQGVAIGPTPHQGAWGRTRFREPRAFECHAPRVAAGVELRVELALVFGVEVVRGPLVARS